MPDAPVQRNLPQFTEPYVHKSYEPKNTKRPGTMADWTAFVGRVAQLCEALYRDARVLRQKRAEAVAPTSGPVTRAEAERNFTATLKRASDHAKELALEFLATGMSREHIENHLELAGTEHDRRPELPIALLYSKLMGIEFEEERQVVEKDANGQDVTTRKVERKKHRWAMELKASEVDDLYNTMRPLGEALPMLATKFRSGTARLPA